MQVPIYRWLGYLGKYTDGSYLCISRSPWFILHRAVWEARTLLCPTADLQLTWFDAWNTSKRFWIWYIHFSFLPDQSNGEEIADELISRERVKYMWHTGFYAESSILRTYYLKKYGPHSFRRLDTQKLTRKRLTLATGLLSPIHESDYKSGYFIC